MSERVPWGPKAAGVAWIISSAVMYAVMNGAAKVGGAYLSIWQIGISRYLFGALVLVVLARTMQLDLWGCHRFLHVVRALAAAAAFLLLVESFKTIPVSVAIVLFYSWPVFTSLLAAWVAGEPTRAREWPFVGAAVLGTALILWPEEAGTGLALGHLLALAAALSGSLAIVLVRRLARDNGPITIYFYLCLIGSISCIVPWLTQAAAGEAPLLPQVGAGWAVLAVMVVPSVLCQLFFNKGFQYLRAPQVGVLMTLEVLLLAVFGVVALGEPLGWRLICGGGLIVSSGVILNFVTSEEQPSE